MLVIGLSLPGRVDHIQIHLLMMTPFDAAFRFAMKGFQKCHRGFARCFKGAVNRLNQQNEVLPMVVNLAWVA